MYVSLARIGHGGTSGSKGDWLSGYLGFPTSIMKAGKEGLGMMWVSKSTVSSSLS